LKNRRGYQFVCDWKVCVLDYLQVRIVAVAAAVDFFSVAVYQREVRWIPEQKHVNLLLVVPEFVSLEQHYCYYSLAPSESTYCQLVELEKEEQTSQVVQEEVLALLASVDGKALLPVLPSSVVSHLVLVLVLFQLVSLALEVHSVVAALVEEKRQSMWHSMG
jgi:hypothetical protein